MVDSSSGYLSWLLFWCEPYNFVFVLVPRLNLGQPRYNGNVNLLETT